MFCMKLCQAKLERLKTTLPGMITLGSDGSRICQSGAVHGERAARAL